MSPGDQSARRASIDDVLATADLATRARRPSDHAAECRAFATLATALATDPSTVAQALADAVILLCDADSAGLSLLVGDVDSGLFRWHAVAGVFAPHVGRVMPRSASPCGDVYAGDTAMLFRQPERHFEAAANLPTPICEALVMPFRVNGVATGSVWAITHRGDRAFDGEDVRLLGDLAAFAAAASKMAAAVASDASGQRQLEERTRSLADSERRMRALVEGMPQLVWCAIDAGEWTWASPQWCAHTGQTRAESLGHGWLDALHPDDRDAVAGAWAAAEGHGRFEVDYRVRHAAEDRYRWFQTRATPVRGDDGAIVDWLGTSTDVDDIKGLQHRQRLLLAELQHRVRNTLAVVRSIARRTAATSGSVDDYAAHLDGRLASFARTQSAVTRDVGAGVDLRTLVAEELRALAARDDGQATIDGPDLRLQPKAAERIALAIHELATNAVKYGALGAENGRVAVAWAVDGGDIVLRWRESGLDRPLDPPGARGFGTELLERSLAYDLDARTDLRFDPAGLTCTIRLPHDAHVV